MPNSCNIQNRTREIDDLHFTNCTHMANAWCDHLKTSIPCSLGMIFCFALVILFIIGGIFYDHERRKEINYDNDMCLVLTRGYRNYTCSIKAIIWRCFSAAWDVRLNKTASINATAESISKYRSINEALARTKEYPVPKCEDCSGQ